MSLPTTNTKDEVRPSAPRDEQDCAQPTKHGLPPDNNYDKITRERPPVVGNLEPQLVHLVRRTSIPATAIDIAEHRKRTNTGHTHARGTTAEHQHANHSSNVKVCPYANITSSETTSLWEIVEQVNASSTDGTENGGAGMPSNPN